VAGARVIAGIPSRHGADALAAFADDLTARLGAQARIERDVPVARFTTYRLGGPAALAVRAETLGALTKVVEAVAEHDVPVLVIGKGSNLVVADRGFAGLAVLLAGELAEVVLDVAGRRVRAGAGASLQALARSTAAAGLSGLEFYVGIPGSVGGAVRMNAGGHGRETADVLVRADVLPIEAPARLETRPVEAFALGYRTSSVGPREIVVGAEFALRTASIADCEATIAEIVRWRREHQPGGANGGSVFANPPGDSAGRLIDSLGLKGLKVGGATVSSKHANFFQAEPGTTADDLHRLIREVQARVRAETGIELVPELRLVGFDDAPGEETAR
jgi:UDP-N-acetylmuramate dehydrogenase